MLKNDNYEHLIEEMIGKLGAEKSGYEFMMVESPRLGILLPPGTLFLIYYKGQPETGDVVAVYLKSGDSYLARISQMNRAKGIYLLHVVGPRPKTMKTVHRSEILRIGVIECALYTNNPLGL